MATDTVTVLYYSDNNNLQNKLFKFCFCLILSNFNEKLNCYNWRKDLRFQVECILLFWIMCVPLFCNCVMMSLCILNQGSFNAIITFR